MKNFVIAGLLLLTNIISAQEDLFTGTSLFKGAHKGAINATTLSHSFGEDFLVIDEQTIRIESYKGSPLLLDKWAETTVLFNDGKLYTVSMANYDALNDQFVVYVKDIDKEVEGLVTKKFPLIGLEKKNIITASLKNDIESKNFVRINSVHFQEKPKTEFFEYFSRNPKDAYVLKSYYKKITHNRLKDMPYTDSHEEYAFKTYVNFYIRNPYKVYIPISLSKKNILRVLDDKANEKNLKSYIKKNKLKTSKPEDVQRLLLYYFKELKPDSSK